MSKQKFTEGIAKIQRELKAPKNQKNNFGNYKYRSCEDILEALKPLLNGFVLTLNDDIVHVEGRFYIKATATISHGEHSLSATGWAREIEKKEKKPSIAMQNNTNFNSNVQYLKNSLEPFLIP